MYKLTQNAPKLVFGGRVAAFAPIGGAYNVPSLYGLYMFPHCSLILPSRLTSLLLTPTPPVKLTTSPTGLSRFVGPLTWNDLPDDVT